MSLSYSLSVENLNNSQFLSQVLANYGINGTPDTLFRQGRFFKVQMVSEIFSQQVNTLLEKECILTECMFM